MSLGRQFPPPAALYRARRPPAMLEAAEQGLGVTLAMAPLIKARPGFGRKLVAPFDVAARHTETIYLVSRAEQARDRRIGALRRWIINAVGRIT